MKYQQLKILLLCFSILIFWRGSTASTLVIKSDAQIKNLKIGEHASMKQTNVFIGLNVIELVNYPNAVYLYELKGRSNYNFFAMVWFATDTSTVQITIDEDLNIIFDNESSYQKELNKIFSSSNIHSLFPYEPQDILPLEPILALEAKAIIQNLEVYTDISTLENLLGLSQQRGIDNWSTDIISAYLREPLNALYDQKISKLIKIKGLDILENEVEIKPDGKKHLLIAVSGSWCGPCVKGLPKLRKAYDNVSDNVMFVSSWNDPDLKTFRDTHVKKKQVISWPNLWDQYGLMANALGIKVYPTYILFDPLGNEIKRWNGKFPNGLKNYTSN